MAKKSVATPASTTEASDESILVTAAKAIGTAAGKVARLAGAGQPATSQKIPKLVKKNKAKLPRKEKKAAKAKAAKKAAK